MGPLGRLLPGIAQARSYRREWLWRDISAGVVLTGLLAPAGMAYATAAGMPPQTGLYATIIPLLVYALVGPSRILVLGPDSSLTPLIAAAVVPVLATDPSQAVAVGSMLAVLAGLMCIAAGFARFGFIAELLSAPVRYGYLYGIALTIIVSQTAKICGFSVHGETLIWQIRQFVDAVQVEGVDTESLLLGLGCLAVILLLKWKAPRVPAPLVVVILGIALAVILDLGQVGVSLVGDLPRGLPSPALPELSGSTVQGLAGASLGIALVAFADTSVLSRIMAMRHRTKVDMNHEMVALGFCNVGSGLFQGFAVSASSSRTPVAEQSGARTQFTGVAAAVVLIGLTFFLPSVFRNLPEPTLAAIVIAAAISLIDVPAMVRLWRVRRSEFLLACGALLCVAILGPVSGVVAAVALSVLDFLRRAWKPHSAELVRVDGLKGYHDRDRHPEGRIVPGLLLFRFDGPLFFANAHSFADDLTDRLARRIARGEPVQCVIVTAEPITDIDTTASDMLRDVVEELRDRGIELRFAELKGTVRERLDRYETIPPRNGDDGEPPEQTARTTGQAVKAYLRDYGVEWTDWEDRG